MRNFRLLSTLVVILVVNLSLFGCASAPLNKNLTPNSPLAQQSTDVVVGIRQTEIIPMFYKSQASNIMLGGLIPALIDAGVNQSRAKSAEEQIKPLRAALVGFDFDGIAQKWSEQALSSVTVLQALPVKFTKEVNPDKYVALMDTSPAQRVMYLNYDYVMNPDFTGVRVGLFAILKPKTLPGSATPAERMGLNDTLFHKHYVTEMYLQAPPGDISACISAWSADDGTMVKRGLEWGLSSIAKQLQKDLLTPAVDLPPGKLENIRGFTGKVVHTEGSDQLISGFDGSWVIIKGIQTAR
jgi:hypothetical protein